MQLGDLGFLGSLTGLCSTLLTIVMVMVVGCMEMAVYVSRDVGSGTAVR